MSGWGNDVPQTAQDKQKVLDRLARLEGQVRGVARMVEQDRYCMDIMSQTAAVRAALTAVDKILIKNHAMLCVEAALESGDIEQQREKFTELVDLLEKTRR